MHSSHFGLRAIQQYRPCKISQLAVGKNVLEVEHRLVKVIPKEFIVDSHHWLILHGRYCCIARKPKCDECIVSDVCNWPDRFEFGAARIATTTIEAEH
jgi:endonuclease-3